MTDDDNTADLAALATELSLTLSSADDSPDLLRRQAALLDRMFYAVFEGYVAPKLAEGRNLEYHLPLLLRLQKQCMDTAKAAEAIAYMQALAAQQSRTLPPPPAKNANELKETHK